MPSARAHAARASHVRKSVLSAGDRARDDQGMEDEELREWLAVFARAIMELRELVELFAEEDDEDGEEEDST